MTVSQLAGLSWNAYQVINNSTYVGGLSDDASAMQKKMGVQNLGAALSLPTQTGDLGAVSNLDAYVSGLYTESQLPTYQALSQTGVDSKLPLSGIGTARSYAQSLYAAQQLGLTASTGSVNLNAVTTAGQSAQISRLQASLQSSPVTLVQLYQNYLSSSFPGAVFSSVA